MTDLSYSIAEPMVAWADLDKPYATYCNCAYCAFARTVRDEMEQNGKLVSMSSVQDERSENGTDRS